MALEKICLHKLNGECKDCLIDLDPLYHSQKECADYIEADEKAIDTRRKNNR